MPNRNLDNWPYLTETQRDILCHWIEENFISIQSINCDRPVSIISQVFAKSPHGFRVPDTVMCDAMADCGYRVHKSRRDEYFFNISEKSPALQEWYRLCSSSRDGKRHIYAGGGEPWKYPHP